MYSLGEKSGKAGYSGHRFEDAERDTETTSAFLFYYSPFSPSFFLPEKNLRIIISSNTNSRK